VTDGVREKQLDGFVEKKWKEKLKRQAVEEL
jgi:hypothetical protein